MGMTVTESIVQSRSGQLRPFLPARAVRPASRAALRCRASNEEKAPVAVALDRRAALLGLLGLGFAADAQAASNPLAQKKDPYAVRSAETASHLEQNRQDGSYPRWIPSSEKYSDCPLRAGRPGHAGAAGHCEGARWLRIPARPAEEAEQRGAEGDHRAAHGIATE